MNWFMNSVGMTWGTECRMEGGNEWDVWDNVRPSGSPPVSPVIQFANAWNHVTVNAQRTAANTCSTSPSPSTE